MKKLLLAAMFTTLAPAAFSQAAPPTADSYYRQGQSAEKAGDPAAAKAAYTKALQINPQHAHARYSLGQLKLTSGAISAKAREAKFGDVIVPEFKVDDATFQESLDALGQIVEKQSKNEVVPNFIVQDPSGKLGQAKISLRLKNLPAGGVMKYMLEMTSAKIRYDEHAIVIQPK